jgi:uncharacterized protein (DUF2141 family)
MIRTSLISATTVLALVAAAQAADLSVDVAGVRDTNGKVMVALHIPTEGASFPDMAGAVAAQWRNAEPGIMRFVFSGLKPGRYAVAVYHDENNNGELDANLMGIPTEGYGFSQEAKGTMGPPTFEAAAVDLAGEGALATTATLSY